MVGHDTLATKIHAFTIIDISAVLEGESYFYFLFLLNHSKWTKLYNKQTVV